VQVRRSSRVQEPNTVAHCFKNYSPHVMQVVRFTRLQARILVVGILIGSFGACSTDLKITTRYAPDFDPKQFETFALQQTDLSLRPSWVDAEVKMTVEQVLTSKGYTLNDSAGADLLVSFQVERNESYPLQFARPDRPPSITFEEGSLTLEIRDSANQRIYRGFARDVVAANKNETRQRLRAAVKQLLADFPARK
jgi:hypothetical protein